MQNPGYATACVSRLFTYSLQTYITTSVEVWPGGSDRHMDVRVPRQTSGIPRLYYVRHHDHNQPGDEQR